MKSKALLLLLGVLLVTAHVARADPEEGEDDGGEDAAPAKPAKTKAKAPAANKGGPPYSADIPLEALSKLPVEPLSMDAAALKDDDAQFELFTSSKSESPNQNVASLTAALNKATALMHKMQSDVQAEKVWTKNVYDIIQNYQYKYLKTIEDVKQREKKLAKMEKLVELLKASTLHAGVEQEIAKAEKALDELVKRAGAKGPLYHRITRRMAKLKQALADVQTPRQLHSETTQRMKKILSSHIPPYSSDALSHLLEDDEEPKKPAAKPAKKPEKAAKKAPKEKDAKKASKAKKPAKASKAKKAKKAAGPGGKKI